MFTNTIIFLPFLGFIFTKITEWAYHTDRLPLTHPSTAVRLQ